MASDAAPRSDITVAYEGRLTEDYIINQINGVTHTDSHQNHKNRLADFFRLYRGELNSLFPEEAALGNMPVVENKVKNAVHDVSRLAREAKGTPVFLKRGEGDKAVKGSAIRAAIANTVWQMGGGPALQKKLYLDLISAGYMAVAVMYEDGNDYPTFLRLNPMNCYPDVVNGQLVNMVYVETLKERHAAHLFPEVSGLDANPKNQKEVLSVLYWDKVEYCQAILTLRGKKANGAKIVDRWKHKLDMVPVAFQALDSADDTYHGLFDQMGGPIMIRNKAVRLMADYLESMSYAPFEEKGILNADDEPSATTVYHHDPNAEQSFMRRVQPAAQSGTVFGLLSYMDGQESAEAIQPPSRVGVVNQSIASGSFVASTQGSLSSVVKDIQEYMAEFRVCLNQIAFKCEQVWLDREKALWTSVGSKDTYLPSKDMGKWMQHSIQYGANAGLNRSEADIRIIQHRGSGFISKATARAQIDYIEDQSSEQDLIDREAAADAFFQRLVGDPNTQMSTVAKLVQMLGKGKSVMEAVEALMPEWLQAEAEAKAAAAAPLPGSAPAGPEGTTAQENADALAAGGAQPSDFTPEFAPMPLPQIISRNPTF